MYVALDRLEILYVTKTVASFVQTPTKSAMVKLKRLVSYLVGYPQAEWIYPKQAVPKYLDVYGDSDWAGDEERKRSTTGVAEVFGSHLLDAVSVTQSLVALSSAEAEFYACNRGTAGGLQTCHFLSEAGYRVIPRVWCDSSACRGIVRRTGTGKLRHLEIRYMWAQERLQKGEFLLKAIPTENNVADLMTKHLAAVRIEELLTKLGVRRCARGLVVASLFTKVEANHFDVRTDHVVAANREREDVLLFVGCVILALVLVMLAVAGVCRCWFRCCHDTATRERQESLLSYDSDNETAVVTNPGSSAGRRLREATLRVQPYVVSLRRGLLTRELKEDLNKRLMQEHGAQGLVEEAAAAMSSFDRRRLGSRRGSLALIDDAGSNREDHRGVHGEVCPR